MIGTVGAFLLMLASGFGVTRLLAGNERLRPSELLAGSWIFGAGVVSLATWVFGLACEGVALRVSISVLAVLLCLAGLFWTRPGPRVRGRWTWIDGIALVPMLAVIVYAVCWSLRLRLGWDSLTIWEAKAYMAWQNGGVLPGSFFADENRSFSHPVYPLLWPYLTAWIYGWNGAPQQTLVGVLSVGFLAAAFLAFVGIVQRFGGPRGLGLTAGAMMFGIPYLFSGVWGLFSGYADFPLGVTMLAAIGFAAWWTQTNSPAALRLLAGAAALLPWIKREGLLLCLGALLVPCICLVARREWRRLAILVSPSGILFAGWSLFLRVHGATPEADLLPMTWNSVIAGFSRVKPVLNTVASEMADPMHWSILWLCFLVGWLVLLIQRRWTLAGVFLGAMVVPIMGMTAAYMLSSWGDYLRHIDVSLPRLILQLAPTALLAFLLAFPWKGQTNPPKRSNPSLAR